MQNANILIVDDEADIIQALKLRLETAGHLALTASNGSEALELLTRTNVDVILADLMMPKLDGLELTRRVRQNPLWLGTQVLLFSCNDDPVARGLAMQFGALDYLSKALGGVAIVSRVNEALATAWTAEATDRRRAGYEEAERDLVVQLRAISESARAVDPDGGARITARNEEPPSGSRGDPTAVREMKDLQNLAKRLHHDSTAEDKRPQDFAI